MIRPNNQSTFKKLKCQVLRARERGVVAEAGHENRGQSTQYLRDLVKDFTLYSKIIKRPLKCFKQGLT